MCIPGVIFIIGPYGEDIVSCGDTFSLLRMCGKVQMLLSFTLVADVISPLADFSPSDKHIFLFFHYFPAGFSHNGLRGYYV